MKTIRVVATCAMALILGPAWAQDTPVPAQATQSAQDVGGTSDASRSDAGVTMSPTRQQVYQDLSTSQQSGEQRRIWNSTYRHH